MIQQKLKTVTSIFRQTYQFKEETDTEDICYAQVMERIRDLGTLPSGADVLMWFEKVVWRLSPVAMVMILLTVFCLTQLDISSTHEVFSLFEDAEEITLAQVFVK